MVQEGGITTIKERTLFGEILLVLKSNKVERHTLVQRNKTPSTSHPWVNSSVCWFIYFALVPFSRVLEFMLLKLFSDKFS